MNMVPEIGGFPKTIHCIAAALLYKSTVWNLSIRSFLLTELFVHRHASYSNIPCFLTTFPKKQPKERLSFETCPGENIPLQEGTRGWGLLAKKSATMEDLKKQSEPELPLPENPGAAGAGELDHHGMAAVY